MNTVSEICQQLESKIEKSIIAFKESLARLRSGRAHPSILDAVMVNYYGSMTPINQVANVSVEDNRTLTVTVWEKTLLAEVEKAILKSDLGLNPNVAGTTIRVPMPPLTEETRLQLVKQVNVESEKIKVSIRNHRRDSNTICKNLVRDKEISEDENKKAQLAIQKIVDSAIAKVELIAKEKEEQLLEV